MRPPAAVRPRSIPNTCCSEFHPGRHRTGRSRPHGRAARRHPRHPRKQGPRGSRSDSLPPFRPHFRRAQPLAAPARGSPRARLRRRSRNAHRSHPRCPPRADRSPHARSTLRLHRTASFPCRNRQRLFADSGRVKNVLERIRVLIFLHQLQVHQPLRFHDGFRSPKPRGG